MKKNLIPQKHNYYDKLMKLIDENNLTKGELHQVNIDHDDWCKIYKGGYCNCDPDVCLLKNGVVH